MEHLASPSNPEKSELRSAIDQEVRRFLDQGGMITVLKGSSTDPSSLLRGLWDDSGDDLIDHD